MAGAADNLKAAAGLIPSIYYDLIARVSPGALVLWAAIPRTTWSAVAPSSDWIAFLGFVGASYVVGLVLTPVGAAIGWPVGFLIRRHIGLSAHNWWSLPAAVGARNDKVDARSHEAGTVLAKMEAEATLCQNLLSGYLLLLLAGYATSLPVPLVALPLVTTIALLVLLLAAAVFRVVAYLFRQEALYDIHVRAAARVVP